jgi:hypothetical protein
MATHDTHAPIKKSSEPESNGRGRRFNVAAVTIEIFAIGIRFDCNRRRTAVGAQAADFEIFLISTVRSGAYLDIGTRSLHENLSSCPRS